MWSCDTEPLGHITDKVHYHVSHRNLAYCHVDLI